jgi:putative phosphoesterase
MFSVLNRELQPKQQTTNNKQQTTNNKQQTANSTPARMKIGLLSDTHGYLDGKIMEQLTDCDEIWHAGDFGTEEVSDKLSAQGKLRGVFGNVDGTNIRLIHPLEQIFEIEGVKVFMIHIGGYPGNYSAGIAKKISEVSPALFICGHSHILKVMPDKKNNLLHMNPGAAGIHGFHKYRTMLKFSISKGKIKDLSAIELGLRGTIQP